MIHRASAPGSSLTEVTSAGAFTHRVRMPLSAVRRAVAFVPTAKANDVVCATEIADGEPKVPFGAWVTSHEAARWAGVGLAALSGAVALRARTDAADAARRTRRSGRVDIWQPLLVGARTVSLMARTTNPVSRRVGQMAVR